MNARLTGEVLALAIDPRKSKTIYAGMWRRGFGSMDGGRHWRVVNAGLTDEKVNALVIHPQAPKTVYAGTGVLSADAAGGVFKSTDGGRSWRAVNRVSGATRSPPSSSASRTQRPSTRARPPSASSRARIGDGGEPRTQLWSPRKYRRSRSTPGSQRRSMRACGSAASSRAMTGAGAGEQQGGPNQVYGLAIDPQRPATLAQVPAGSSRARTRPLATFGVYAECLGARDRSADADNSTHAGGVFKSTDGGCRWRRSGLWRTGQGGQRDRPAEAGDRTCGYRH